MVQPFFFSWDVFLETHGRWIQQDSPHSLELLETCKKFEIKVKVSFDKMHGLKPADLKKMWDKLNSLSIKTFVAITEDSKANFEDTRQLCEWIPESQIIAQAKATTLENLVRPRIGVIDRTSNLNRHLTTRFFPKSESEVVA